MPVLTHNQEAALITALGALVAPRLIALINTPAPTIQVVPRLFNHTPPTYVADTDYSETIDGFLLSLVTPSLQSYSYAVLH